MVFYNESNQHYCFFIKKSAEELKSSLAKYTKNYTFQIEKQVTRTDKMGEEFTSNIIYIFQVSYSARFRATLITFLKQLNVNLHTMIKNVKFAELNATAFLNTQMFVLQQKLSTQVS